MERSNILIFEDKNEIEDIYKKIKNGKIKNIHIGKESQNHFENLFEQNLSEEEIRKIVDILKEMYEEIYDSIDEICEEERKQLIVFYLDDLFEEVCSYGKNKEKIEEYLNHQICDFLELVMESKNFKYISDYRYSPRNMVLEITYKDEGEKYLEKIDSRSGLYFGGCLDVSA